MDADHTSDYIIQKDDASGYVCKSHGRNRDIQLVRNNPDNEWCNGHNGRH